MSAPSAIEGLRRRTQHQGHPLARYHDDPVGFVHDCIEWPEGQGPAPYQDETLANLVEHRREALRGPHTLGKSTTATWAILWFANTRDAMGEDWKIPTTASAWLQLTRYLWPEVHKWVRRLRWDRLGREPYRDKTELLDLGLKLRHGEAFGASPSDPAYIEGAHATQLLYVYDEAKAIPIDIWDAAEGAFAGAGPDTDSDAYALAISTPGEPNGRFYEIHKRQAGTEDWHTRHVTKDEAIAAGRMSAEWAADRRRQWGAASATYQNRVEGEFASSDEDGVIPLGWIEAANLRWAERHGDGFNPAAPLEVVGVDCSGTGSDRTVLARRHGDDIGPIERPRKTVDATAEDQVGLEEMATAGRIVAILGANIRARAIVDAGGLGSGVVGRVREKINRQRVVAFVAGAKANRKDRNGEFGFANVRSAAWWAMREALDPDFDSDVALPPDDDLTGDLTAPHWREVSAGRIQVESKDEIRKRLGRSTDTGDAVVQAFWPAGPPPRGGTAARRRVPTLTG